MYDKPDAVLPVPGSPFGSRAVGLGDGGRFRSGGTASKGNPAFWTGPIPWVSPKDMKLYVLHDAIDHISNDAVAESATNIAPVGAVLVLVRGMGLAKGLPVCLLA